MIETIRGLVGVVGRILLCAVFFAAALGYAAPDVGSVAQFVASKGPVSSQMALVGGVVILIAGSLSVVVGYKARLGALLLLLILILATYHFHSLTFWTMVSTQSRQEAILHLVTNLLMVGALLFIIANGAGQMSMDKGR